MFMNKLIIPQTKLEKSRIMFPMQLQELLDALSSRRNQSNNSYFSQYGLSRKVGEHLSQFIGLVSFGFQFEIREIISLSSLTSNFH